MRKACAIKHDVTNYWKIRESKLKTLFNCQSHGQFIPYINISWTRLAGETIRKLIDNFHISL